MSEVATPRLTAQQLLASIKNQARRAVYDERDDSVHFEQHHYVKDEAIRQRILIERAIIRRAVRDILATQAEGGPAFCLSVFDGEATTVKCSRSVDEIMGAIGTTDEDELIVRRIVQDAATKYHGVINLVYGNDGWDVIADCSVTVSALLDGADALASDLGELL